MNILYHKEINTEGNDCIISHSYLVINTLGQYVAIGLRRYYGGPYNNIMLDFIEEFDTEQEAIEFIKALVEED